MTNVLKPRTEWVRDIYEVKRFERPSYQFTDSCSGNVTCWSSNPRGPRNSTTTWIRYPDGRIAYDAPQLVPKDVRTCVRRLATYRYVAYTGDFDTLAEAQDAQERLMKQWACYHPTAIISMLKYNFPQSRRLRIEVDED